MESNFYKKHFILFKGKIVPRSSFALLQNFVFVKILVMDGWISFKLQLINRKRSAQFESRNNNFETFG